MKHLKVFEEYYDDKGNTYDNIDDIPVNRHLLNLVYIHPNIEDTFPRLKRINDELRKIQYDLEDTGPADGDIEDAIGSIDNVFKKWEDRPLNKDAKKYNL